MDEWNRTMHREKKKRKPWDVFHSHSLSVYNQWNIKKYNLEPSLRLSSSLFISPNNPPSCIYILYIYIVMRSKKTCTSKKEQNPDKGPFWGLGTAGVSHIVQTASLENPDIQKSENYLRIITFSNILIVGKEFAPHMSQK
ncbi:hypothetical protein ACJX0J_007717, partial [Zea mays]